MTKYLPFAVLAIAAVGQAGAAENPCTQFKWDLTSEIALFGSAAQSLAVARTAADAPAITPGKLYSVALHPQERVTLAAPISKKMLDDGAFGGLVKIRLQQPGMYRISVDGGFWIDVADGLSTLARKDFSGSQNCSTPRKVVLYDLPSGRDLLVQLTGAATPQARLTVVRVESAMP